MAWPWPSFGGYQFKTEEQAVWETDAGWVKSPSYSRSKPFGSATDVITTLAIGSAERTFEVYLTPERFDALELLLNTKATFTDWTRPVPDSRMAFLSEVTALNDIVGKDLGDNCTQRRRHTRLTFISA